MTKQGMGQLVADLEKKGYVERVEDPADGRARLVRLKKGWRHVRDAREIIGEIEEAYARRLGDGRLEALRAILKDLSEIMQLKYSFDRGRVQRSAYKGSAPTSISRLVHRRTVAGGSQALVPLRHQRGGVSVVRGRACSSDILQGLV